MRKRVFAFLLAAVLLLAMGTAAFAAQEGSLTGGSITINNAEPGQVYNAYQILYLESYNTTDNAYAYKVNPGWADFFKAAEGSNPAGAGLAYVDIDAQGYVTWKTGADAAAFAKAAQAYAKQQNMTADATATAPAAAKGQTQSTVTLSNLKLGYWLVDTTLGTLCALDTTNPNVEMREKNTVPTNVKTVEEDSTGNYGATNDADIGGTVNFKSTVTLPAGSENVTFHDTMSTGLTLTANSIKVYTDENMTTELAAANYTVTSTGLTDGCTFEISFTQTYLDSLTATATVYVGYSAVVNENAVIGLNGNPNTSKLSYGDSSNTKTTPDSVTTTYTWDLDVLKYANGDEAKVLKDAKFVLLKSDKNEVATIVNGKVTGWVNVPAGQDGAVTWPADTVLTTGENGKIEIDGLDADTYYLRETEAPAGYNKLAEDVEVKITGATTADGGTALSYSTHVAEVENKSGALLPSAGGTGTRVLYIVGAVLVIGAGVLLVVRRRMNAGK